MDALKEKYIGKYVGEDKIAGIEVDGTTDLGSVVFNLTFENGKKKLIPEKGLVVCVSNAKQDATKIYGALINAISDECVKIVGEYDLPSYLFDRIGAKLEMELRNHVERAGSIVWFGGPEEYAPGFNSSNNVTLLMADRINKKFPPKKDGE